MEVRPGRKSYIPLHRHPTFMYPVKQLDMSAGCSNPIVKSEGILLAPKDNLRVGLWVAYWSPSTYGFYTAKNPLPHIPEYLGLPVVRPTRLSIYGEAETDQDTQRSSLQPQSLKGSSRSRGDT